MSASAVVPDLSPAVGRGSGRAPHHRSHWKRKGRIPPVELVRADVIDIVADGAGMGTLCTPVVPN